MDCALSPDAIVARCLDHGIDAVAITDHNEIQGARALQRRAPFRVIVGEEVKTAEGGEIIGLFLTEKIEQGLPAKQVIARIRAQGGLVYFPHPFDTIRRTAWPAGVAETLLPDADIIEVFNARNVVPAADEKARAAATRLGKALCAGADAHLLSEYGRTVVFLPPFETPAELLESLRQARFAEVRAPWWVGMRKRWRRLWK